MLLISFLTVVIVYVLYYFTLNRRVEVYKYTVSDLHNHSHTTTLRQNNTYTNYINADLYNSHGITSGMVNSVNHHTIKHNVNHVSTLTTYKTKYGTVTCNIYYETKPDKHYLYGNVKHLVSENETGDYVRKKVTIQLEGRENGERILTIVTFCLYKPLFV